MTRTRSRSNFPSRVPMRWRGGMVAADVNNDGLLDYLYTGPAGVGAYDHFGKTLWVKEVDVHLLGADGVVVNGSEVHVYWNRKANPNRNRPRLWTQNHYRRSKMNWNYYSPRGWSKSSSWIQPNSPATT